MSNERKLRVDYWAPNEKSFASTWHEDEAEARRYAEKFVSDGPPDTQRTANVSFPIATYYMRHSVSSIEYAPVPDSRSYRDEIEAALKPPPAAVTEREIPEGFTRHDGSKVCPVDEHSRVSIAFRVPGAEHMITTTVATAGTLDWSTILGYEPWTPSPAYAENLARIQAEIDAYRIIEASASAASVPSDDACALPGSVEESRDHLTEPSALTTWGQHEDLRAAGFVPVGAPSDDSFVTWERRDHSDDASEFSEGEEDDGSEMFEEDGPGYAPVVAAEPPPTNPEADALAKAADYYSPEAVAERNKFNPFAMFRREET